MKKTTHFLCCCLALALPAGTALAQNAPRTLSTPPTAPAPTATPAPQPSVAPLPARPAPSPPMTPAPPAPAAPDPYLLGRTYRVETLKGTTFTGVLVSMSLTTLEFDARELGHIKLERDQIRVADLEGPVAAGGLAAAKPGYYDIGNGNRLFFAPTGRGLRRGEASLQDVSVYLLGINYGINDNLSLGGYLSVVPGLAPQDQLLVLTPKLSFPLNDNVHFGVGVLYLRVPTDNGSTGAGIVYGALTRGSADNNVTVGVGYGFVQGDIGKTPILQVGGQTRVSRRVSLVSENYIIADARAGMGGLYGMKLNWRRTSLGMGAVYFYSFPYTDNYGYGYNSRQGGYFFSSYVIPLYFDFTFRFGKGAKRD